MFSISFSVEMNTQVIQLNSIDRLGPTLKSYWFAVYRQTHSFTPYQIIFCHFLKKNFFASIYSSFAKK